MGMTESSGEDHIVAGKESRLHKYASSRETPKWQSWPLHGLLLLYSLLYLVWVFPLWITVGVVFDPFKWMAKPIARLAAFLTMVLGPLLALGILPLPF